MKHQKQCKNRKVLKVACPLAFLPANIPIIIIFNNNGWCIFAKKIMKCHSPQTTFYSFSPVLLIIVIGNTFVPLLFCGMEHKRYLCGVQLIIVLLHDVIIDVQIVNY